MEEDEITFTRDEEELVIRALLHKPQPSSTGKTKLLASSHGVMFTGQKYKGKEIAINFNAFIYAKAKAQPSTGAQADADETAD